MRAPIGIQATKGSPVYPQVARTLSKLGRDISLARRMRRIAAADFARQIGISRATLHRLESGDPGISLNTLTMALFVLGKLDRIADLAEPARDDVGLMLAGRDAPRRIRRKASPSRVVDVAADRSEGDSTIAGFEAW